MSGARAPEASTAPPSAPEPKSRRPVYFAEAGEYVDCAVYDRYSLPARACFPGPAIIEEFDSTVVVHPQFIVRVDDVGNLIIEREKP